MCIDAHVSGSAGQAFVFPVRNMFPRFRVDVLFREAEVDDVDYTGLFRSRPAQQEVLRLNVPVDEVLGMDVFDPIQLLIGTERHRSG